MAETIRPRTVLNPADKFTKRAAPRRASRRNTGEIVSFVLNPGQRPRMKGRTMANSKKKKKTASHHKHHYASRPNTGKRRHYKASHNRGVRDRRRSRRNPAGMSFQDLLMSGVFNVVGAVGSKLLTQMVLGSNNTGFMGYAGNIVSGVALGLATGAVGSTRKYSAQVYIGMVTGLIIRVISDYTSYGSQLALSGIGDYQVQNFATPQRLSDGLHSAAIAMPAGWGAPAPVVVASAAPPAGHAGGLSGGLYDGSGLYN
jgi:hypothetical protein